MKANTRRIPRRSSMLDRHALASQEQLLRTYRATVALDVLRIPPADDLTELRMLAIKVIAEELESRGMKQ